MKRFCLYFCLLPVALLTACASAPKTQYYTLSSASKHTQALDSAPFAISVAPVAIPEKVDRPQIVLSDAGGTQVNLLNNSQWAAPLAEEVRAALALDLSRRLGVLELALRDAPKTLPLWVIHLTVQRFDSIYGDRAVLEATWRQTPRHGLQGKAVVCSAAVTVPVEAGVPALVEGHQQALARLAALMADTLSNRAPAVVEGTVLKGCA
ncbi:MAG TPA: PqiC family protein [Pusillimonas sp.]|uniref:PqiC family protein n=1 Tax=Pusillimonas sp. TaxID=3040095 RepID=UPI002C9695E0|nr:PqiC family protein [Pusillimonas sp.]HUH86845.1 PqiC family protein [Pusillimonas sp.]